MSKLATAARITTRHKNTDNGVASRTTTQLLSPAKRVEDDGARMVTIEAPKIQTAVFEIEGTAPLVIHRFDKKTEGEFAAKIEAGTQPKSKKRHDARSLEDICEAAKYIGKTNGEKWEGFNAVAIRLAMIAACRLADLPMTLAKMSVFVEQDGWDIYSSLIPLIRIKGKSELTQMIGRTQTGVAMLIVRPKYFPWSATVRIRYDAGQFRLSDVSNLLLRAGTQVGICEGRPFSKNSGGMGWGTFQIVNKKEAGVTNS